MTYTGKVLIPPAEYGEPHKLLALCIWREARGESPAAKAGVAAVIGNRCRMAPAQGFRRDVAGNVLKPWAFTSFMEGDPNSVKYPAPGDYIWADCLAAAESQIDGTGGAVFYHDVSLAGPPHAWGDVELSAQIGRLKFYRIKS